MCYLLSMLFGIYCDRYQGALTVVTVCICRFKYIDADKSLARPGREQTNVSVRMALISFGALPCRKKNLYDSSRLDVVEIARGPDMPLSCI